MKRSLEDIKALINDIDRSDPFAAVDLLRLQAELKGALPSPGSGPLGSRRRKKKGGKGVASGVTAPAAQQSKPPSRSSSTVRHSPARQAVVPKPAVETKPVVPVFWSVTGAEWAGVLRWCEEIMRTRKGEVGAQLGTLANHIRAIPGTASPGQKAALINKAIDLWRKLGHLKPPVPGHTKANLAQGHRPAKGKAQPVAAKKHGSGKSVSPVSSPVRSAGYGGARGAGSTGEAFAGYNRGRSQSFEDSVALRQAPRTEQRKRIDRMDRSLTSGSREDLYDLDD